MQVVGMGVETSLCVPSQRTNEPSTSLHAHSSVMGWPFNSHFTRRKARLGSHNKVPRVRVRGRLKATWVDGVRSPKRLKICFDLQYENPGVGVCSNAARVDDVLSNWCHRKPRRQLRGVI
jgi:hypothetical protein